MLYKIIDIITWGVLEEKKGAPCRVKVKKGKGARSRRERDVDGYFVENCP